MIACIPKDPNIRGRCFTSSRVNILENLMNPESKTICPFVYWKSSKMTTLPSYVWGYAVTVLFQISSLCFSNSSERKYSLSEEKFHTTSSSGIWPFQNVFKSNRIRTLHLIRENLLQLSTYLKPLISHNLSICFLFDLDPDTQWSTLEAVIYRNPYHRFQNDCQLPSWDELLHLRRLPSRVKGARLRA